MRRLLKLICEVAWIKTIYFNVKYLPLKDALRLPIFIYRRTALQRVGGEIVLNFQPTTGAVKIGPHGLGTQDIKYSRTIWEVSGRVTFNGKACIGRGSSISVGSGGQLVVGENFNITGKSDIICHKEITFGSNCLLSWDVLVMDTDFHRIVDGSGRTMNEPRAICIGNHVWIGCRNTILKGVTIADNVVIAANSTVTKSVDKPNCIVGGSGAALSVIKEGIDWEY